MLLVFVRHRQQVIHCLLAYTRRQGSGNNGIGDGVFAGLGGIQRGREFTQRAAQVGECWRRVVRGRSNVAVVMAFPDQYCVVASQYKYIRAINKILICDVADADGEYHSGCQP
jgi:hypothetical protein